MKRYNRKKNIAAEAASSSRGGHIWNVCVFRILQKYMNHCDRSSSFMASGQQPEAD